jgi:hypothetical protein
MLTFGKAVILDWFTSNAAERKTRTCKMKPAEIEVNTQVLLSRSPINAQLRLTYTN